MTAHGPMTPKQAHEIFSQQGRILGQAGVDLLIVETFANTEEILVAIRALAEVTDVPIVAQMTVNEDQATRYGEPVEQAVSRVAGEEAVDVVGLNCSIGPSSMLTSLERIRSITGQTHLRSTQCRITATDRGAYSLHVYTRVHGRICQAFL